MIEFALTENDYLHYQLYTASLSKRIIAKRKKSKFIVPLIYLLLGVFPLINSDFIFASGFFFFAVLWFFIYPLWESRYYYKHYQNFIKENYSNQTEQKATLEFNGTTLLSKGNLGESKINLTKILDIVELRDLFILRLDTARGIIIPKSATNTEQMRSQLKEISKQLNKNYKDETQWEWK